MESPAPVPEPRPSRLRRFVRSSLFILIVLLAILTGYYWWQPYRIDFFPHKRPSPNPPVDPDSKRLFSPGVRVTLVTAHPDDAEFYLGGLLSRLHDTGAVLSLIVATDGDKAYIPWADHAKLKQVRRAETEEAAHRWGAHEALFLGYHDSRLTLSRELVLRIADALHLLHPEYVLLFDGEYPPRISHRDHRTMGTATEEAAKQAGEGKWLLHFSTSAPNFAVDVTPYWARKKALLHVHASQFGTQEGRIDGIIAGQAASQGHLIGVQYAEAFRCERR